MKNKRIIASLTSFPARISSIHQVIESIVNQSFQADKIILYLADEQFPEHILPEKLTDMTKKYTHFEIHWWPQDIKSFKKLVPGLIQFPDDIIITLDDDIIYPPNIIKRLIKKHRKYPHAICGCRVKRITVKNNKIERYNDWKFFRGIRPYLLGTKPQFNNLATTGGGTLFPPHCLHPDTIREDLFMNICPTTDELWFWAMGILKGTKTAPAGRCTSLNIVKGSQVEALNNQNVRGQVLNNKSLEKILEAYPEIKPHIIKTDPESL